MLKIMDLCNITPDHAKAYQANLGKRVQNLTRDLPDATGLRSGVVEPPSHARHHPDCPSFPSHFLIALLSCSLVTIHVLVYFIVSVLSGLKTPD